MHCSNLAADALARSHKGLSKEKRGKEMKTFILTLIFIIWSKKI